MICAYNGREGRVRALRSGEEGVETGGAIVKRDGNGGKSSCTAPRSFLGVSRLLSRRAGLRVSGCSSPGSSKSRRTGIALPYRHWRQRRALGDDGVWSDDDQVFDGDEWAL